MEMVGIDEDVKDQIYKLASSNLCSAVSGQIMTVRSGREWTFGHLDRTESLLLLLYLLLLSHDPRH